MNIPREIDNDDCKKALRAIAKAKRVALHDVEYPIETGALLWHGLLVAGDDGMFSLSARGACVLVLWDSKKT
jgi:hypothetical protein